MTAAPEHEEAAAPPASSETVQAASSLLAALAAPMRLSIVALLLEHGSRCVHQLVDDLGAPQPLVSQHLRVLRGAGLVVGERRHREVHYALVDPHVGHIVRDALDHVSHPAVGAGPVPVVEDGAGCPVDDGMSPR
ncbi:ArsR/SmtB family transcription factor [Modestobacter lacusdianchii]